MTKRDKTRPATRAASAAASSGAKVVGAAARTTRTGARVGARAGRSFSRGVHKFTSASGAGRTGLANLIELTAAGSAADAFVAVALAGTLFFSASLDQARSRVALALIVTMAPFAVLAPLIGPMLDRVQQGRRFLLAGTLLARGLLCWGMAGAAQTNDALTLFPAAFGVLVLQKAYGVTRSAVTPRLLPQEITLVSANARMSMASLIASTVGALVAAGIDLALGGGSGGAAWVLRVGTVIYLLATAVSFRVPEQVDTPGQQPSSPPLMGGVTVPAGGPGTGPEQPTSPAGGAPQRGGQSGGGRGPTGTRPGQAPGARAHADHANGPRWRTLRRVGPVVGEAMRANATLRSFSGFMVFFLAFLLREEHFPGVSDKLALGSMIIAAGAGGFLGTAVGSALRARRPYLIMFGMLTASIVITACCAAFFGLWAALVVALVAAFGQVLCKLALDSTVQHEIGEEIRSSALAASETVHQLAWVAGGLAGLAMSLTYSGVAGLSVSAILLTASLIVLIAQRRRRVLLLARS